MKKLLITLLSILLIIIVIIYAMWEYSDKKAKKENWERTIGKYVLDVKKTNLGRYRSDSNLYKKLTLKFYRDYTFKLNMKVPFIYADTGGWTAAGVDLSEWNTLTVSSGGTFSQFGRCCTADSTIMLNSMTPQDAAYPISQIFFKKLNPKTSDFQ